MIVSVFGFAVVACSAKHASDFGDNPDGGASGAVGDGGSSGSLTNTDSGTGGTSGTAGPGEVFGHSSDTLYKLDPTTNTVTTIGKFSGIDTSCDLNEGMWDIALDKDGNMYGSVETEGSGCSSTGGEIVKIDKTTAATTVIGTSSSVFPNSLSFVPAGTIDPSNEVLVGYNGATYVRIDPTSGAVSTIGSLNPNVTGQTWYSSGDIVSIIGGKTYLTATLDSSGSSGNDSILEVDPVTGKALIVIGEVGFGKVWGLGFWAGTAYGFDEGGDLFSIDLTSGASTKIPLGGSISNVSFFGAGNTTAAPLVPPR
ncbi:MAG: hypothetical protein ABI183_11275 [Polyangiaceae bacterium]